METQTIRRSFSAQPSPVLFHRDYLWVFNLTLGWVFLSRVVCFLGFGCFVHLFLVFFFFVFFFSPQNFPFSWIIFLANRGIPIIFLNFLKPVSLSPDSRQHSLMVSFLYLTRNDTVIFSQGSWKLHNSHQVLFRQNEVKNSSSLVVSCVFLEWGCLGDWQGLTTLFSFPVPFFQNWGIVDVQYPLV